MTDRFKIEAYTEKGHKFTFSLPTHNGDLNISVDNFETMTEWIKLLQSTVEQIQEVPPRDSMEETQRRLKKIQEIFPERGLGTGHVTP